MAIVPDASVIVSLIFPDEDAAYAKAVLDAIDADRAVVPTLFWFELRNALLMGERRKRITAHQTGTFLADLRVLPFEVDDEPRETVVLELARRHTLTVYDAAYLELAQRKNLPLATIDGDLIRAATAAGVIAWKASP
ncbi:MAG: type II toxin-antitoxin system VapC family toxin [Tepidisphaeraceae bacterium]|jgi:predicted nucleic acid-binding protein